MLLYIQMQELEYTLAHGSRNLFVTIDAVKYNIETNSASEFVREACDHFQSDGALFLEWVTGEDQERYLAMNMYNTDGTQAEMCGNGMRIIARMADERYLHAESFTLYSGGRPYPIRRGEPTVVTLSDGSQESIPNYGVKIAIRQASKDFTLSTSGFVAQRIEALHPSLTFTYLNLGNPHIVAEVSQVDLETLSELGERVKELQEIFPHGVNVSFMQRLGEQQIFVATYERGVGLTASCGTAMTASSTTAALLGVCRWDEPIEVRNRGGFVKCVCHRDQSGELTTELIGNATYVEDGVLTTDAESTTSQTVESFTRESEAWDIVTK